MHTHASRSSGPPGYSGQELVRLLARHPAVTPHRGLRLVADRQPPAACPASPSIWDGVVEPSRPRRRGRPPPTPRSCRCPKRRPPTVAPALVAAGVRVIDLSGAFRLRDLEAARQRWYPKSPARSARRHGLRPRRARRRGARRRAARRPAPGATRPRRCWRLSPLADAGLLAPDADVIVDAKSGVSGAGKARDRAHALLGEPRQRRGLRHLQPPAHGRDRAGTRPPGDLRAAPRAARSGHPRDHLRAPRARHDRRGGARRLRAGVRERAVRPADRRRAAGDQARRAHATSATSAGGSSRAAGASSSCRASTTC